MAPSPSPDNPLCRVALLPDCHVSPSAEDERLSSPMPRLYGKARWLTETYIARLAERKVDALFLLGDTLDPADEAGLAWLRDVIARSPVPVHPIIGNHECYGAISEAEFHRAFGLPDHGNHVVRVRGVPFVMLATPGQDSLAPDSLGFAWLAKTLAELAPHENVFCCAHYSLLLHPCVQGAKNDGMQVLRAADAILALLRRHPNVRAWIAGHKNVPSKVVCDGVLHLLSPQLIQAPCGYRIVEIGPDYLGATTHEIEEDELAELSRAAYGAAYPERHGRAQDRDFQWRWPSDISG